jgi:hypothetical protein
MENGNELRQKAREAILSGRIPSHPPERTWGGRGVGANCAICGRPVTRDEVEFEVEFGSDDPAVGNYRFHYECHAAWDQEAKSNGLPRTTNGGTMDDLERRAYERGRG